ncbi:STAS domain-containing protein [Actinoplanes sp. NPDC026623]|uniref:STAS domain-containing protein n=1 Tax=Actinoplanes sp. NPDC026623 TaxID=3155610 RepID=UPI0033D6A175
MASFEARTAAGKGRVTVVLHGECDLTARAQLTAVLLDAVGREESVFVDVAGVSFFDSTGVQALVIAHHAARRRKGQLFVVNAGGAVAAVLELTGLDALLRAPAEERRHG